MKNKQRSERYMIYEYGTSVFTKRKGAFGNREECPVCHRVYKKEYIQVSTWGHLCYIPLFPMKKTYFKMCPICGNGFELDKKQGKVEMQNVMDSSVQNVMVFAKHILANKKSGLLASDESYEVWVRDLTTGEEICIVANVSKDIVKKIKKERGLKNLPIYDV